MTEFAEIWTYLSTDPLLWLTLTLAAYGAGDALFKASGRKPMVNPVLIAVAFLAVLLQLTGTSYATYFAGAQFVHFMLGPATVALAIPLYANLNHIKKAALPMIAALVAGSLAAMLSAVGIGVALGLDADILLALIPKSATAPVALGVSEAIGGSPTGGRAVLPLAWPVTASGRHVHFKSMKPQARFPVLAWGSTRF